MSEKSAHKLVEKVARMLCVVLHLDPDADWRDGGEVFLSVEVAPEDAPNWTQHKKEAEEIIATILAEVG